MQTQPPLMETEPFRADVTRFLRDRVESVTQLEILLLVHRGPVSSIDIGRRLGISALHVTEELRRLERNRLVRRDDITVTLPEDADLSSSLDALADLYPRFRVAVARAIFAAD